MFSNSLNFNLQTKFLFLFTFLLFISFFILVLSFTNNIKNYDLNSKSKNLVSLIEKNFSTENNISVSKAKDDNSIIINGNGKIIWSLNNFLKDKRLETNKNFFISSKIELLETSYRSYATIQIKNNKNGKIISLNEDLLWEKNKIKTQTIKIPNNFKLSDTNVGIALYCRICTPSNTLKIHSIHLVEDNISNFISNNNILRFNSYIKWLSIISIIILYIGIFKSKNLDNASIRKYYFLFLGFGSLIIVTVAFSLSAPTEGIFGRADSWATDIVARSIASGYGIKAYNIPDWFGYYPLIPIYYSFFYIIFGIGYFAIFFANTFLICMTWYLISFISGKFSYQASFISLLFIVIWAPFYTYVPWTMSEPLSNFYLVLIVFMYSRFVLLKKIPISLICIYGLILGLGGLIRTEFYLITLLSLFFLFFIENLSFKNIFILLLFLSIPILIWTTYQNISNKKIDLSKNNYVSQQWSSEANKIKIYKKKIENIKEINLNFYLNNFKMSTLRPNLFYVYDVPFKYNEEKAHKIHKLIIYATLFLIISNLFLTSNNKIIFLFASSIILERIIVVSLISDSPRYFIPNLGLVVLINSYLLVNLSFFIKNYYIRLLQQK